MFTTTIHHRIRLELGLSLQDYTIMDYLSQCAEQGIDPSEKHAEESIGVRPATYLVSARYLDEKGLVQFDPEFKLGEKWLKHFDHDQQFEFLWKLHSKGTKKIAKKRWDKLKGKVDFEQIKDWLIKYVASKPPEKKCFLNGLDVILVPENRRWENPIIPDYVKQEERKQEPKTQTSFFDPKPHRHGA